MPRRKTVLSTLVWVQILTSVGGFLTPLAIQFGLLEVGVAEAARA